MFLDHSDVLTQKPAGKLELIHTILSQLKSNTEFYKYPKNNLVIRILNWTAPFKNVFLFILVTFLCEGRQGWEIWNKNRRSPSFGTESNACRKLRFSSFGTQGVNSWDYFVLFCFCFVCSSGVVYLCGQQMQVIIARCRPITDPGETFSCSFRERKVFQESPIDVQSW
jgi:hypothetical protein